jgi:hypothetical protein
VLPVAAGGTAERLVCCDLLPAHPLIKAQASKPMMLNRQFLSDVFINVSCSAGWPNN